MAYTGVEYLDTQKLLDAANKVDGCIKEYKEIIKNYICLFDYLFISS